MEPIRYSQALKLQIVREVEKGEACMTDVSHKYGIRGHEAVMKRVRRYGIGRHGKVDLDLVLNLVGVHGQEQPRLGVRKLYHLIGPEVRAAGVKLGRDRLFARLREAGWLVPRKPAEWPKTTRWDRSLPVFRNLLKG